MRKARKKEHMQVIKARLFFIVTTVAVIAVSMYFWFGLVDALEKAMW